MASLTMPILDYENACVGVLQVRCAMQAEPKTELHTSILGQPFCVIFRV